jgi:hypothetical protein
MGHTVLQNGNCMSCDEQCTLGKRQDNGAKHASNLRIKFNTKTLTINTNNYVNSDLVIYVMRLRKPEKETHS